MSTKEVQVLENEVTLMGKTFNVSAMLQPVDEDEKVKMVCDTNNVRLTSRARDTQEMWFLTENGVYKVLMLSRKPVYHPNVLDKIREILN